MKSSHQTTAHFLTDAPPGSFHRGELSSAFLAFSLAAFLSMVGGIVPSAFGQAPLPHRADNQGWELVPALSDEFNENALDEKKWDTDVPSWGVWSWDKGNAYLKDGNLHIRMVYAPHKRDNLDLFYKSGIIRARDQITYGYFEARIKGASKFPGVSPAFWMCNRIKTTFEGDYAEVDFVELQQNDLHRVDCNLHARRAVNDKPKRFKSSQHWMAPWDPRGDFHIYACETTPETITWFVDGRQIAQAKNVHQNLPMSPMFSMGLRQPLRIHAGSDGDGKITFPNPEASTPEGFPTEMTVDYVRVWKRADSKNASPPAATKEP
jgi:kappa-carrageenase